MTSERVAPFNDRLHTSAAGACMHVFFAIKEQYNASARVCLCIFHLMQKINTHSSKRRICKWCGEPKNAPSTSRLRLPVRV